MRTAPAAALLVAALLAGCGGDEPATPSPAAPAPSPTTSTLAPTTTTAAAATTDTTAAAAGDETSTTRAARAACTQAAILPLLKRRLDNPAQGLVIVRADIWRCRNGYARVFAVPRQNPPGEPQFDAEQLFLRSIGGAWTSVAEGTGISCDDTDIRAALLAACRALGYRR